MNLKTLVFVCLFAVECYTSSLDQWCVSDDDANEDAVYQSALEYLGSSTINQSHLQQLIDDVFLRAGCHLLQITSLNNISCEQVKNTLFVFYGPSLTAGELPPRLITFI